MNASSESGLWATRMVRTAMAWMRVGEKVWRALRSSAHRFLCLIDSGRDLGLVSLVFRALLRQLRCLCGDETPLHALGSRAVARIARRRDGQNETKKMSGVLRENRIGLRARHWRRTGDFRDPSHVVARVGILSRQHHVGGDAHLREKGGAVFLALRIEAHDAVIEPVGALARRQRRNVGSANRLHSIAIVGRWRRGLGACVDRGRLSAEMLAGNKGDERQERDPGYCPWQRGVEPAVLGRRLARRRARGACLGPTPVAELGARGERCTTRRAERSGERRTTIGTESAGRRRGTARTGRWSGCWRGRHRYIESMSSTGM